MKQIKRITAIALAIVMLFSLASCSLVNASETDITNDNIKIGVILNGTQEDVSGSAGICNTTIKELTDLGYGIKYDRFKFIENVDPTNANAVADAYKNLINFECSIIIAAESGYMDDTLAVADANPSVLFLVPGTQGNGKNICSYNANITGASYLAGIAAGLKAAQLNVPKLGYIVRSEKNLSTLNAFFMGAKSVNPAVTASVIAAGDDTAAAAQKLITDGCVVIASDFDDEAIAKAAADSKVFFCGFGTEAFSEEDYENAFLCAPLYSFTQFFIDTFKTVIDYEIPENASADTIALQLIIKDGLLKDYNGGYATGAAYLSDVNPLTAAEGSREAVRKAADQILKGELKFEISASVPEAGITIVK